MKMRYRSPLSPGFNTGGCDDESRLGEGEDESLSDGGADICQRSHLTQESRQQHS